MDIVIVFFILLLYVYVVLEFVIYLFYKYFCDYLIYVSFEEFYYIKQIKFLFLVSLSFSEIGRVKVYWVFGCVILCNIYFNFIG